MDALTVWKLLNETIVKLKTIIETNTHAATSKTTPADADEFPGVDSADSYKLKKFTWANIKATLDHASLANVTPMSATGHPAATAAVDGYATATQITKLDGIAAGSQVNVLEGVTGTAPIVAGAVTAKSQAISISAATTSDPGSMSAADKTKLDGIAAGANAYVHPNHSGDVTSVADGAQTIGAKKVTVAMLADGTDGELITWDSSGHAAVVAAGTATHVLTSNGAGAAPTFQAPTSSGSGRELLTGIRTYYVCLNQGTCTISIANPGVVTDAGHGLENGDPVVFSTTGALPTGLTSGTAYYVVNKAADTFEVSATLGGASINTSGSQSGTQSYRTGNDANDGLAATRTGAFLTIQKAITTVCSIDLGPYNCTIQLAVGKYTELISLSSYVGAGPVTILGDAATPANVWLYDSGANWVIGAQGVIGTWALKGIKISSASGGGIYCTKGTFLNIYEFNFGACAEGHMECYDNAGIFMLANYTISGNAKYHMRAAYGGTFRCGTLTCTLTGTPAWTTAGVSSAQLSLIAIHTITFSGSATGKRYVSNENSEIFTNGGGANFVPGNAAGSTANGGIYI